jgi:hypothetical protein
MPARNSRRTTYCQLALEQLPRFLSTMDRQPFSPTYGCAHREFWLTRAVDFPSAIAQFGLYGLALAWAHPMPGNRLHGEPKVRDWVLAGLEYLARIQHGDGSFDEFYPNERGWAGPTGFLLHALVGCLRLLDSQLAPAQRARLRETARRAARFLGENDEAGVLANHHAMAALPVAEAAVLLHDPRLHDLFQQRLDAFMRHVHPEGWCLEYDGADPGYLSATVSFLAKLHRLRPEERIEGVIRRAIRFAAYFVTPNGHYGGTSGSRQTVHFYPHGMELWAGREPLAAAMADRVLDGIRDGATVWPALQEDRYFVYRLPEFLQAYLDFGPRPREPVPLPYERDPFVDRFPGAGIEVRRLPWGYLVANLARGGVVKLYRLPDGQPLLLDSGILAELASGSVCTSQWIDPAYEQVFAEDGFSVRGSCHVVPTQTFTPLRMMAFRTFLLGLGWHHRLARGAKGLIRSVLTTRSRRAPLDFHRQVTIRRDHLVVTDRLRLRPGGRVQRVLVGDDLPLRYVPQSRYFQPEELEAQGLELADEELARLNSGAEVTIRREVSPQAGRRSDGGPT